MEIWKDIKGYEGLYSVSDLGNVKSLSRTVFMKGNFPYTKSERLLNPSTHKNGYLAVGLTKNNKTKTIKVHQLVAIAFLNHNPCGMKVVVDHVDNDRNNNKLSNIQLTSQRKNASKDRSGYTSDFIGVCWNKSKSVWKAQISINGTTKLIGNYEVEIEASEAYQKALNNLV